MQGTRSLLNSFCAKYRDQRNRLSYTNQLKNYAKSMAQDCEQSLETGKRADYPGCRFRDAMHFCYAQNKGQLWCSQNPQNSYCNDGGAKWAIAPVGTATTPGETEWTPNTGISELRNGAVVAGSTFDCQCMKDCTCTSAKCWCVDKATKPTPANKGLYATQLAYTSRSTGTGPIPSSSKTGKCSCTCGTANMKQMGP